MNDSKYASWLFEAFGCRLQTSELLVACWQRGPLFQAGKLCVSAVPGLPLMAQLGIGFLVHQLTTNYLLIYHLTSRQQDDSFTAISLLARKEICKP